MPTYEFRCPKGHDFEEFFLKMSDAKSELPCPTCGEIGVRQMSAGGGLLFKGSGFYITDYGKDGKKSQALSKPAAGKPDAGKPDAGKPDAGKPDAGKPDAGSSESGKSGSAKSDASSKSDSATSGAPKPAPARSEGGSGAPSSSPKSGSE